MKERDSILRRQLLTGDIQNVMEYGKLPPQAQEMEEAVLGAIMLEKDAIDEVLSILTEESFYVDKHQRIWKAIQILHLSQRSIDLLTVTEQLKKQGDLESAGGPFYIATLTNKVASAANVKEHSQIIAEKYLARQLISTATETIRNAYSDISDPFMLLSDLKDSLFKIDESFNSIGEVSFQDQVFETSKEIKEAAENGYIVGVPTGSRRLDARSGGYKNGDLILIAARPSMGKTTFTISNALKQVKQGIKVAYVSLEVSSGSVIRKMYSNALQIDGKIINKGGLVREQWERFDRQTAEFYDMNFHIYDGGFNIDKIVSWINKVVQKHGVQVVYLDYIQLAEASGKLAGQDANRDVTQISNKLKGAAKKLRVPIVALSQLSRAPEKRGGASKPILSDLRDSGSLEQTADMVMFLYRPEYYKIWEYDLGNGKIIPTKGIAEVDIAKFRNGDTGAFLQMFDGATSRFDDYDFNEPTPF